ncbi:MAG TPA: carboxypeptidase-like regulatory domain-containing protein [Pyrinomonadaceae bacterium]|nr:carboxypeptidase-like regulatory domain-containing protein [Pyrinomonadaceae bacterium]
MKRLLLVIIASVCLPLLNLEAQACECAEHGTPICAEYWRSDAVFVGKLESIKPLKNQWDDVYEYAGLHFVVEQAYRGVSGKRVVVGVPKNTLCDPKFKTGKRYIMYASLDKPTNQLFTGMCRRVGLAEHMRQEEIDYLRKVTHEGVQETISGRVVEDIYRSRPGISVRLKGNGKEVTTKTDKDGGFLFSLPGPGYYEVQVSVPYTARFIHLYEDLAFSRNTTHLLSTFEYYITLDKNQCHYLEVNMSGTDPSAIATVSGNVVAATGEPVNKGMVSLINV